MARRADISILKRLQDDPNTAPVVEACQKAIQEGSLQREELQAWEASPAWIFNAPVDIPVSLRDYAYRLLASNERQLVETHMARLVKSGMNVERLVTAVREFKELHGRVDDDALVSAYRENPYILGQCLSPDEMVHLDEVRPKRIHPNSLPRLRAFVASSWRYERQQGRMTLRPKGGVLSKAAQALATDGVHNKAHYAELLREHFAQIVPSQDQADWPYAMKVYQNDRGEISAMPGWIHFSQWQAARAMKEHTERPLQPLPTEWEEWVASLRLNDPSQEAALSHMWTHPLTIVVGDPGTGKTRLLQALKKATERFGGSILGCSPTGIGAKRVQWNADIESQTVHRRFKLTRMNRHVERGGLEIPLTAARFLACDEAGMLELFTFHAVAWGTPCDDGARLILVGDEKQLPPVGYGQPFIDLLQCEALEPFVVRLDQAHRTPNDLTKSAEVYYDLSQPLLWGESLRTWNVPSGVSDEFRREIRSWLEGVPKDTSWQVFTPFRGGSQRHDFGAFDVNGWLNDGTDPLPAGRRIVQQENSVATELRNGETGYVARVDADTRTAMFDDGTEITLPHAEAYREWMPADCLTFHKGQGGEYDHTLVVLPPGSSYVDPRSLFMALTRSKRTVTVMAQDAVAAVEDIRQSPQRNPASSFGKILSSVFATKVTAQIPVTPATGEVTWDL